MEYTRFVMVQGIVGGFLVRIPVFYIMSKHAIHPTLITN